MSKNIVFNVFCLLMLSLSVVLLVRSVVVGVDAPLNTFGSFLEILQNAPSIEFTSFSYTGFIASSWGAFDFLRVFINGILSVPLSIVDFVSTTGVDIFEYVRYFFRSLFFFFV